MSTTAYSSTSCGQGKAKLVLSTGTYDGSVSAQLSGYFYTTYSYASDRFSGAFTVDGSVTRTGSISGYSGGSSKSILLGNYGKTLTRGTSAYSKTFYFYVQNNNTGAKSTNASVTVTVPALAQYSITYNSNGGSGAPSKQYYYYSSTVNTALSSTIPVRDGYKFLGWSLSSIATSLSYSAGQAWGRNNKGDYTLYAVWEISTCYLTYDANGGTNTPNVQSYTYSSTGDINITSIIPIRTGYNFINWNTIQNGSGTSYESGSLYSKAQMSRTIYAQWLAHTHKILYNLNNGDGTISPLQFSYSETGSIAITSTVPVREGYKFEGWSEDIDATTGTYQTGANINTNRDTDIILYSIWSPSYTKPLIENLSASRCDSTGLIDDFGTYLKIQFKWTAGKYITSYVTSSTIRISVKADDATAYTIIKDSQITSSGAIFNSFFGTYATEKYYDIKVEILDSVGSGNLANTFASIVEYALDVMPKGNGMALGTAATEKEKLEVGWDIQANKNLKVDGNLEVDGKATLNGDLEIDGKTTLNGNLEAIDEIKSNKFRSENTGDISLTSTEHAFQIGSDNSNNIAIDTDEIMARNNGVASNLYLNSEGGNVYVGGNNVFSHLEFDENQVSFPYTAPKDGILTYIHSPASKTNGGAYLKIFNPSGSDVGYIGVISAIGGGLGQTCFPVVKGYTYKTIYSSGLSWSSIHVTYFK